MQDTKDRSRRELAQIGATELSRLLFSGMEVPEMPFARQIELMMTEVAGCRYREDIRESLKTIKAGDRLLLLREPENPYDERAIMVLSTDERFLGYIPRRKNEVLTNLMDAGKMLYAKAEVIDPPEEDDDYAGWYEALIIRVFMED